MREREREGKRESERERERERESCLGSAHLQCTLCECRCRLCLWNNLIMCLGAGCVCGIVLSMYKCGVPCTGLLLSLNKEKGVSTNHCMPIQDILLKAYL